MAYEGFQGGGRIHSEGDATWATILGFWSLGRILDAGQTGRFLPEGALGGEGETAQGRYSGKA